MAQFATYDAQRQNYYENISLFGSIISAFKAWNDARRTRKSLMRLSDHQLADIGLIRVDVY